MLEARWIAALVSLIDRWPLAWPALAFAATTAVGLAVRAGALAGLGWWCGPGPSAVRATVRGPSRVCCLAFGLYAANEVALDATRLPVLWYAWAAVTLEAVMALSLAVLLAGVARCTPGVSPLLAGFRRTEITRPLGRIAGIVAAVRDGWYGDGVRGRRLHGYPRPGSRRWNGT